jgi:hypothetical protein
LDTDLYYEKLAWFKENEKPEPLLIISDNTEMIKTTIAWMSMSTNPCNNTDYPHYESEDTIWSWLWENTEYSCHEFIDKLSTSLSQSGMTRKLKPLISNRIIYPDGTVNSYVQKYLREQVILLFQNTKTR